MSPRERAVILNVDDNPIGRYAATRLLQREGFEVLEAANAAEALRLAAAQPDLILLDSNLPDSTGLEVCRALKSRAQTQSIPVLHVSANPLGSEIQDTGVECEADVHLTQPIEAGVLVATIRAILHARQAEREARAAEHVWRAAFQALGHGVCLIGADGLILQVNRALCGMLGQEAQALIGRPEHEVLEDAAGPEQIRAFERARRSLSQEVSDVEAGGRWFHVTTDPLLDESGRFSGAVRTVIDVTEQRRAAQERERLLREFDSERARLEAVLRQMPAGVIMAEAPSGTITLRNVQVESILRGPFRIGGGPKDYLQYPAFHLDGRPYSVEDMPLARAVASGETVTNEEIRFARGDGSRATVLVSSVPIRNREGYVVAGMAVLHDVSDRHEIEAQLRRSQKMEAMARLAGGAAHDFNNLLTIIGGYGQMAMDALKPEDPVRRDLEAILEASARATALTRQLLTFSRRQIVQPKTVELNRHILRIGRMLRRLLGEDIELVMALKAAPARIWIDPAQLEQVLLNVAVNARDAMPTGGRLTISTGTLKVTEEAAGELNLTPGLYVTLTMSDTGTGMSAETLSHLFEPFYTTKSKGKGTGLGLSTVYGIVKQGGGEILVKSELGHGTTVNIYFAAAAGGSSRPSPISVEHGPVQTGTETILVVEDDPEVRRLASQMLARQGYSVVKAASAAEALRLWKNRRDSIDLVLSDVIMPHMSGPQMVERMRDSRPGVRVLYMSGYTGDVIAKHGLVDATSAFLPKPFTLEELARMVRSVLDQKEPQ
ncbi:MAG TPA: response regulator [Bryobacteraceae bacterium]